MVEDRGFKSENNSSADVERFFHTAIKITGFIRDVSAFVESPIEAFDTGADYSTVFSTIPVGSRLLKCHNMISVTYAYRTQVNVDDYVMGLDGR